MDLREACIEEALKIIEASGVENLSMREVSRRLGVSHQAPYKHFPSRDHILAEVVRQAFEDFASHLHENALTGNTHVDLAAMGRAYLSFALEHPLQYRLMFGTPLPNPADHPEMMESAKQAFSLLRDCLAALAGDDPHQAELDALFVWSTLHGFASIMQTDAVAKLQLPEDVLHRAAEHSMYRIGVALGADTELLNQLFSRKDNS